VKARLIYHEKLEVKERYTVEYKLHDVGKSERYPDCLKYSLICFDIKTKQRVLMDNHHPKGPHYHINDDEFGHKFISIDKLIEEFKLLVFNHLGVRL